MIKRLKNILGIESVKVELQIPEEISKTDEKIDGVLLFSSQSDATILSISIKLIEKYSRGRKEDKLIDEYMISNITVNEKLQIAKDEEVKLPFELPFQLVKSPMDELESQNFFYKGIVKLAKKVRGVKSEYRVVAEATVKGTALQPFSEKKILVK